MSQTVHWWTSRYGGKVVAHPVVVLNRGDYVHVRGLTGRWKGRAFSVVSNEVTSYIPLGARLAPGAKAYDTREKARATSSSRDRTGRGCRVVVIATKTGKKVVMAPGPFTHAEAVTVLRKITRHPGRQEMIEEIPSAARDCIGVHTHDPRVSARYLRRASRDRGRTRTRAKASRRKRTRR